MDRRDVLSATVAGAVALTLYVRTLAPGIVADLDTPMFQFIGRVLGVAHNPGYPLYVLVTYPISLLPVWTLPYRINLVSAVLGAVAVSLVFLAARMLGCRRLTSVLAALGFAFGRVFWSQAVIAEVYTMHAVFVAGVLVGLLAWERSRRAACYYAAVAALAAGLAHHTTIVAFAPAAAAFVWMVDRSFFRARTLVATALVLAVGLAPYLFVVVRSNQPGVYLESKATTLAALPDVILARQFRDRVFAFDWQTVIARRLPAVMETAAAELTLVGLALAAVGTAVLLRRRHADALLLLLGAAAIVAFALNYAIVDTPVFLIPSLMVAWLLAAVGAEQIVIALGQRSRWPVVGAACLVLPAWLIAHNFDANDRSRDTAASAVLDRLFEHLPSPVSLVREDFLVDRLVQFKRLVDRPDAQRSVDLIDRDVTTVRQRLAKGATVLAFGKSARHLRLSGLSVDFAPRPLGTGSLADLLAAAADGSIVAIAVPSSLAAQFAGSSGSSLAALGGPGSLAPASGSALAVIGVRGCSSGAVVHRQTAGVESRVSKGVEIGTTGVAAPTGITARADDTHASIRQGDRDVIRTTAGAALAVWEPDGRLAHATTLQAIDGFHAPIPAGALSVFAVRPETRFEVRSDGRTDLTRSLATGGVVVRVAPRQTIVLHVADDGPLWPRVAERSGSLRLEVTSLDGDATAGLDPAQASQLMARGTHRYRVAVVADGPHPASALLAVGGIPNHAIGQVVGAASPGAMSSVDYRGLLRAPDSSTALLLMARDEQSQLVGDGWSSVEADEGGGYRWLKARQARLVLPVSGAGARLLRLQAFRRPGPGPSAIAVAVNGAALHWQTLEPGWKAYEWAMPAGTLPAGYSEAAVLLDLAPSPVAAAGAVAVADLRIIR